MSELTSNELVTELRVACKSGKGNYGHRLLCGKAADHIDSQELLLKAFREDDALLRAENERLRRLVMEHTGAAQPPKVCDCPPNCQGPDNTAALCRAESAQPAKHVSLCQHDGCNEVRTIGGRYCVEHESAQPPFDVLAHVIKERDEYRALIAKGKGEHGQPGYVCDETWAEWQGSLSTLEYIANRATATKEV